MEPHSSETADHRDTHQPAHACSLAPRWDVTLELLRVVEAPGVTHDKNGVRNRGQGSHAASHAGSRSCRASVPDERDPDTEGTTR